LLYWRSQHVPFTIHVQYFKHVCLSPSSQAKHSKEVAVCPYRECVPNQGHLAALPYVREKTLHSPRIVQHRAALLYEKHVNHLIILQLCSHRDMTPSKLFACGAAVLSITWRSFLLEVRGHLGALPPCAASASYSSPVASAAKQVAVSQSAKSRQQDRTPFPVQQHSSLTLQLGQMSCSPAALACNWLPPLFASAAFFCALTLASSFWFPRVMMAEHLACRPIVALSPCNWVYVSFYRSRALKCTCLPRPTRTYMPMVTPNTHAM